MSDVVILMQPKVFFHVINFVGILCFKQIKDKLK